MKNRREYVEYWSAIIVGLFWIHSSFGMPHVIRIGLDDKSECSPFRRNVLLWGLIGFLALTVLADMLAV